jgi:GMP synthase-like glutamine amidotransferase
VPGGLVLQNDSLDPPAILGDWLGERRIPFETVAAWEDGVPPDPSEFAWIAALGSRHSVADTHLDWIRAEVGFMRNAVAADVPVLGICFGGQALAAALGGEIAPADPVAVGWLETQTYDPDLVSRGPWLHFNTERFTVPDGATLVASIDDEPSAFRLGPHVGVQFHPEATPSLAGRWADHYVDWLGEQGLTPEWVREQAAVHSAAAPARAFALFDAWWAGATGPA